MFVTTPAMRLHLPSQFFTDIDVWDLVELELQIPVLLVKLSEDPVRGGPNVSRTFFAKPTHLREFLQTSGVRVESVDLLSPPRMNETVRWALNPLAELWHCLEPSVQQFAWLYRIADGREYSDSALGTEPQSLRKHNRVFVAAEDR